MQTHNDTPQPSSPAHSGQFALLGQRRFAPFFIAQVLGAINDNIFRFAFIVMVTSGLMQSTWLHPLQVGSIVSGVFVLPFLLFSATAGQLTDKLEKARIMRLTKDLEIAIALLAAWGFVQHHPYVLLGCTFLMGLHSTLFGPVKYAYLPAVLHERELVGGNGMVEMGTFVSILLGQLAGTLLVSFEGGVAIAAVACLAIAVVGRVAVQFVPQTGASAPDLKINWNPFSETWRNLRLAYQSPVVFRSLLGISWMWFFGAAVTTQFPALSAEVLQGNSQVTALLLVVFSVSVGIGALLCETLSNHHVEIGLVPLGAIGMSAFGIDLYFALHALPPLAAGQTQDLAAFVQQPGHWRLLIDLAGLALSSGIYSVPMYALVQLRSPATHRARIIAANNILNAVFMIASAVMVVALLGLGFSLAQIFLVTAVLNALVAGYIFFLLPEYLLRFVAWVVSNGVYRFKVRGSGHIPLEGPAVLLANHVSFADAVLLMSASPRPVYFLMDSRIFKNPLLGWLFKLGRAIPIAPKSSQPEVYERAMQKAQQVLAEGDVLGIFPEGGITRDGQLQPFKPGLLRILKEAKAQHGMEPPLVPAAIQNMWGSYFSRIEGEAMKRPLRRGFWSRVGLHIGPPLPSAEADMDALQQEVQRLLDS